MRSDNLEDHIFWSKQPVSDTKTKLGDEINEPVNSEISSSEISKTPITLPEGFEWCTLGLKDPYILKELYRFLRENYIEDSSLVFKLEYSEETLYWALVQPGYFPECIIGIRQKETGELVATIAATPDELTIRGKTIRIMLVDFLCVQQKLRSKRISPVLIKEITRLSNLRGIFQALHTGAIVLPTCISAPIYYHRFLNPKKLLAAGFCKLPKNMKLSLYCKLHKTPENISTRGFRDMRIEDVPHVTRLLNDYQKRFKLSKIFHEKFVLHCLIPQKDIIYSYVVENDGIITDFISFYSLKALSTNLEKNDCLKLAMLYYYAYTETPLDQLIKELIVSAKKKNFDVINALEIMENIKLFENNKFVLGTGVLRYYLFNWRCSAFKHHEIGVFLV